MWAHTHTQDNLAVISSNTTAKTRLHANTDEFCQKTAATQHPHAATLNPQQHSGSHSLNKQQKQKTWMLTHHFSSPAVWRRPERVTFSGVASLRCFLHLPPSWRAPIRHLSRSQQFGGVRDPLVPVYQWQRERRCCPSPVTVFCHMCSVYLRVFSLHSHEWKRHDAVLNATLAASFVPFQMGGNICTFNSKQWIKMTHNAIIIIAMR